MTVPASVPRPAAAFPEIAGGLLGASRRSRRAAGAARRARRRRRDPEDPRAARRRARHPAPLPGQRGAGRADAVPQALAPAHRGLHHLRLARRCPSCTSRRRPFFNAGAYGIDKPFIVIHSAAIELLDDDELRVLLAHELGHVMSGHALYRTIAAILALDQPRRAADPRGHRAAADPARLPRVVPQVRALRRPRRPARQPGRRGRAAAVHEDGRRRPGRRLRGTAQRGCVHAAGQRVRGERRGPRHRLQDPEHARAHPSDAHRARRRAAALGRRAATTTASCAASTSAAAPSRRSGRSGDDLARRERLLRGRGAGGGQPGGRRRAAGGGAGARRLPEARRSREAAGRRRRRPRARALLGAPARGPRRRPLLRARAIPAPPSSPPTSPSPPTTSTGIADAADMHGIDLTVVGPEVPLARGPRRPAARRGTRGLRSRRRRRADRGVEGVRQGSHGAPRVSPPPRAAPSPSSRRRSPTWTRHAEPLVVKASGLAAGKGAIVCATRAEAARRGARDARRRQRSARPGRTVVDRGVPRGRGGLGPRGDRWDARSSSCPPAQDHKRLLEGDAGPNTGGMGAYSPVVGRDRRRCSSAREREVLLPDARASCAAAARRSRGVLYAGLMVDADGRARGSSSSTAGSAIPRRRSSCRWWPAGSRDSFWRWREARRRRRSTVCTGAAAVTTVLAARGYPDAPAKGAAITIPGRAARRASPIFHAGTPRGDGRRAPGQRRPGART